MHPLTRATLVGSVQGLAVGTALAIFLIWLLPPPREFARRQFMADCMTARGADNAGLAACAADWPRYQLAKAHGWEAR